MASSGRRAFGGVPGWSNNVMTFQQLAAQDDADTEFVVDKLEQQTSFDFEACVEHNTTFMQSLEKKPDLVKFLIVQGKAFGEWIRQCARYGKAKMNLIQVRFVIDVSGRPTDRDLTRPRAIAMAHRVNFKVKDAEAVRSSLIYRIDLSNIEKVYPGFERLVGSGFSFQRAFLEKNAGTMARVTGLTPKVCSAIMLVLGSSVLDFAKFRSDETMVNEFPSIDNLLKFMNFLQDPIPGIKVSDYTGAVNAARRQLGGDEQIVLDNAEILLLLAEKVIVNVAITQPHEKTMALFKTVVGARTEAAGEASVEVTKLRAFFEEQGEKKENSI